MAHSVMRTAFAYFLTKCLFSFALAISVLSSVSYQFTLRRLQNLSERLSMNTSNSYNYLLSKQHLLMTAAMNENNNSQSFTYPLHLLASLPIPCATSVLRVGIYCRTAFKRGNTVFKSKNSKQGLVTI